MKPNNSYYKLLPLVLWVTVVIMAAATYPLNMTAAIVELIVAGALGGFVFYYYYRRQKHLSDYFSRIVGSVSGRSKVLTDLDMPVMLTRCREIIWYNSAFKIKVLSGRDCIGCDCGDIVGAEHVQHASGDLFDVHIGNRVYTINMCQRDSGSGLWLFNDITELSTVKRNYNNDKNSCKCSGKCAFFKSISVLDFIIVFH